MTCTRRNGSYLIRETMLLSQNALFEIRQGDAEDAGRYFHLFKSRGPGEFQEERRLCSSFRDRRSTCFGYTNLSFPWSGSPSFSTGKSKPSIPKPLSVSSPQPRASSALSLCLSRSAYSRYLASRCPGFTSSSGRLVIGPSGWEPPSPSPAFSSPSGRASTSAATGATPSPSSRATS